MEITTTSDETDYEILCGLLDSDAEGKKAIRKAFKTYAEKLADYINSKFPGLFQDEEIKDIVQATFLELFEQGRKGTIPQDKPVLALLFRAGLCNAKDTIGLRKRYSDARAKFALDVDGCVSGTKTGRLWDSMKASNQFSELKIDFLKFVKEELKGQQKLVGNIVGYRIPDALDYNDIIHEVYQQSEMRLTKVQVKKTWEAIRDKFRMLLEKHSKKGY
jgi:hypothetical protein